MLASSSGVAFGHLLAQSSSVVLQEIGPLRRRKPPPPPLQSLRESGTSLGRPCAGSWRAEAHEPSSRIAIGARIVSGTSAIESVNTGQASRAGLISALLSASYSTMAAECLLSMAAQQPQAGDEPVWVKDDDEDLEELVDLNLDKEAESAAHARQIDLQVAPGCWR